jgi:putative CocE/NonD family hydrolase
MKRRSRRRAAFFWSMAALIAAVGVGGATFADPAPPRASKSYYLPMSDGTRIALSLYFPGGNVPAKPTSTLLVQTRYGRASELEYAAGLEKDYVFAVIDTRGSTSSFGQRRVDIGPDEAADMEQVIAHLARQPWSNGKVYSYGLSYMADTADVATSRPAPELAGAIIREVDFDTFLHLLMPGGVPNDVFLQGWGEITKAMDEGQSPDPSTPLDCRARAEDCAKLWPTLDRVDEDKDYSLLRQALSNRKRWLPDDYANATFHDAKGRNGYALFDSSPAYRIDGMRKQAKPALVWGSWVDGGTAEAALARYRSAPNVPMEIWIGANDHPWRMFADPFFPDEKAPAPAADEQHRILSDFLGRLERGDRIRRRIHYYVLGASASRKRRCGRRKAWRSTSCTWTLTIGSRHHGLLAEKIVMPSTSVRTPAARRGGRRNSVPRPLIPTAGTKTASCLSMSPRRSKATRSLRAIRSWICACRQRHPIQPSSPISKMSPPTGE